ncbi:hypothetical protein [Massilia sp. CCM 8734]|uniref:hypothetical protein n=1 Tax=Massilia sp. CCM 8734 TaxID=2609283 RepID=UPI001423B2D9|nr:hypothetical protein [Massilia sp. CCM 8734]NHZ99030.1 hypothetical protein [Massilia sp. CCM 8734]
MLANARIEQLLGLQAAADLMKWVARFAEADGMTDAARGIHTMPVLFDDELMLASWWCQGQERHAKGLDKAQWRMLCEKSAHANRQGCGLSHDEFIRRLSADIDRAMELLPYHELPDALTIAIDEFDYQTAQQCEQVAIDNSNDGYCCHGIQMGCCPAGCDFPDEYFEDEFHG